MKDIWWAMTAAVILGSGTVLLAGYELLTGFVGKSVKMNPEACNAGEW